MSIPAFFAVARFQVPEQEGAAFAGRAGAALEALAARPGYVGGSLGRSADDPTLWALVTRWAGIGAYRRALSAYDVRIAAVPLLSQALDEPGAFEPVLTHDGEATATGSSRAADADEVGIGRASAGSVATTLTTAEPSSRNPAAEATGC